MRFTVEVTHRAESDVSRVLQWLRERSLRGAAHWLGRYHRALKTLATDPRGFGTAPESLDCGEDLREISFKTRYGNVYRLVFVIRSNVVHVLRLRTSGQPLLSPTEIDIPE
jgi:plasmid stabilization system protein ParE